MNIQKIEDNTIILMNRLGLVKDEIIYYMVNRKLSKDEFKKKHPNFKNNNIIFSPNRNASKYIFDKFINKTIQSHCSSFHKSRKIFDSPNVREIRVLLNICDGMYDGYKRMRANYITFYFEKQHNGKLKKISKNNKKVKEHNEILSLTKILSG